MKFADVNVYRARYDLVVRGAIQVEEEPAAVRVLVAMNFEEAVEMARAMKVRGASVHEAVLRDVVLLHTDVAIRSGP